MALIHLLTAQPNAGKTEAVLDLTPPRTVFFTPSPQDNNKRFNALPWAYAHDLADMDQRALVLFLKKYPRVRLVMEPGEAYLLKQVFMNSIFEGVDFVFNDFPVLFITNSEAMVFAHFAAGIRHRQSGILVTTQRVCGVLPPLVRNLADQITQVGPLVAEDEAKILYRMGGSAKYRKFDDFYAAISTIPPYTQFSVKSAPTPTKP